MSGPIRAEIVNAFLEPAMELLKTHLHGSNLGAVQLTDALPPPPTVSVNIMIQGKLVGPVRWTFDQEVARALASSMGMGPLTMDISSPECLDALAEVANIIAGNATGTLADAGYPVEVAPPTTRLLLGPGIEHLAEKSLHVTLRTPAGEVKILFGLKTNDGD